MTELEEYTERFGALRFDEMGMTEVDNAIFSRLAYLELAPFTGRTLGEAAEEYALPDSGNEILSQTAELLRAAGRTKRFGYIEITNCREIVSNDLETAFYALTFSVDSATHIAAFRGTDDKVLSFYDDAKLAYSFPISCQTTAMGYLTERLAQLEGDFYVCGHSKGGNMAMFAYLFLRDEEKRRIIRVYNNDGPGFPQEIADIIFTRSNREKIYCIMPEDSIIGRILTDPGNIRIVKSTAHGASQHNIFTWEICGAAFDGAKRFSMLSEYMEDTLTQSLESLPAERMKNAADAIFDIAKKSGIKTLKDVNLKNVKSLLPALARLWELVDEDEDDIPVILRMLVKNLMQEAGIEKTIERSAPGVMDAVEDIKKKLKSSEQT